MEEGTADYIILYQYIGEVCDKLAGRVMWQCQRMPDSLSGNDTDLRTVWDHVCVQMQGQHSIFWDAYENVLRQLIEAQLYKLSENLRKLIWFESNAGTSREDDAEYNEQDVIDHILDRYVLSKAVDYTNHRIERYPG